jgi:hypothetical protein
MGTAGGHDLVRLSFDRGRRSEARELLAPVHAWFSEGLDTPDLREVKGVARRAELRRGYIRKTPLPVVWVSNRR